MIIIVCGLPGSGKSTLAEKLAKKYKLKTIFASSILKELKEKPIDKIRVEKTSMGSGWWESKEGMKYTKQRMWDMSLDKALDTKLLEIIAKEDNLIIDSRTMPWLAKKKGLIKIWIDASEEIRAKRIAGRDKKDWKGIMKQMHERLETDKKIYKKLYGFRFGPDKKVFDIILNTDKLDEVQVFEAVNEKIQKIIKADAIPKKHE